ncbi:YheE family protein [Bacillus sp. 31A1R]|uniref:YheE family protein n=1 Tax=Robertmurraya mangrovi TaxID=3098077 RepID=A0ABU5ISR4_9BACI|nr:YheE family protein [Bacillus sp. 31A1R]MDZ5470176.1 YheE family protein [Bacillus sp. 31A1R]
MITHFQYKPLYENKQMPGWRISFYYKKQKFNGIYHPDGKIEWTSQQPESESEKEIMEHIHSLMYFHVYDQ